MTGHLRSALGAKLRLQARVFFLQTLEVFAYFVESGHPGILETPHLRLVHFIGLEVVEPLKGFCDINLVSSEPQGYLLDACLLGKPDLKSCTSTLYFEIMSSMVSFSTAAFINADHGPLRTPCCMSNNCRTV